MCLPRNKCFPLERSIKTWHLLNIPLKAIHSVLYSAKISHKKCQFKWMKQNCMEVRNQHWSSQTYFSILLLSFSWRHSMHPPPQQKHFLQSNHLFGFWFIDDCCTLKIVSMHVYMVCLMFYRVHWYWGFLDTLWQIYPFWIHFDENSLHRVHSNRSWNSPSLQ